LVKVLVSTETDRNTTLRRFHSESSGDIKIPRSIASATARDVPKRRTIVAGASADLYFVIVRDDGS